MGQRIPVTLGNIAPLTLKPFHAGQLALVCEGGGQRGIFTAGVLDEFMRAQFNPFDLYFGTSAGAQNLSAYVCNQLLNKLKPVLVTGFFSFENHRGSALLCLITIMKTGRQRWGNEFPLRSAILRR